MLCARMTLRGWSSGAAQLFSCLSPAIAAAGLSGRHRFYRTTVLAFVSPRRLKLHPFLTSATYMATTALADQRSKASAAVLYHYPCPDGAFAALAAHLYFSAASLPVLFFPNRVYEPIRCESLPLNEISDVYLLDFVGPPGFVADISSKVERLCHNPSLGNHHKTALEALGGNQSLGKNVTKVIDMNRSDATIAFEFFKEKALTITNDIGLNGVDLRTYSNSKFLPDDRFERIHRLFKYIEDEDLWKWSLSGSKAFGSGLKDMHLEYDVNVNPNLFEQLLELDPEQVIGRGQATLLHKQKLIEEALEKSYEIALGNGRFGYCLAVDADSNSNLRSELGHQLANKSQRPRLRGIGAVVYKVPELNNDEMLKISLRSVDAEDSTVISQEYGGGGHQNASSFILSRAIFEGWKLQTIP